MKHLSINFVILLIFLPSCSRQYDEPLQIVYRRSISGISQIMIMNQDGSNQHQITNTSLNESPSWSADAEKIVFTNNNFIYTMNSDGSGLTQITYIISYYPTWSPDGKMIAFYSNDGDQEIFLVNSDGSGLIKLTNNVLTDMAPAWLPDSSRIAFLRDYDIYVMNSDGTNAIQLTFTAAVNGVALSPDGSKIAYETGSHIWVMNYDGSNQINLTIPYTTATRASWSPRGDKIVFATSNFPRKICIINSDGTGFIQLTSNSDDEDTPCFQGKPR